MMPRTRQQGAALLLVDVGFGKNDQPLRQKISFSLRAMTQDAISYFDFDKLNRYGLG